MKQPGGARSARLALDRRKATGEEAPVARFDRIPVFGIAPRVIRPDRIQASGLPSIFRSCLSSYHIEERSPAASSAIASRGPGNFY